MAILSLSSCSRKRAEAPAPALTSVRVQVTTVQREVAPAIIEVPGIVRPAERATIAARIPGVIETLSVTLGQSVKRGELLVGLATPELSARLAQARVQLEQAEREEKRNRELASSGADTADAARAAAERLRSASAAVAESEAMLAYAKICAPYDGRVAQKLVYAGDLATPGLPLLVFERASALQVEAAVPASLAPALMLGAEFAIQVSSVAAPTTGTVTEIAAAADPVSHTVLVKLDLSSPDPAWSGRTVRVQLRGEPAETLLVPTGCVSRFGQIERVFVVADTKAVLRLVKTGALHGDRIELLAGVTAGETIVLAPPGTLRDGQPILAAQ